MSQRAQELRAEAERLEREAGAWAAGETGERRVGAVLDRMAAERRALVLHDRLIRPGSKANLDHIAVTPAGVFIVDAKNWYGYVNAAEDALHKDNVDQWRTLEYGKDAAKIAKGVAGWLPVFPVVCLTGAARIMEPRRSAGVTVLNVEDLEGYILGKPAKATPEAARGTHAALLELFPSQPGAAQPGQAPTERGHTPTSTSASTPTPTRASGRSRAQGQRPRPVKTRTPPPGRTQWEPPRIDWPEYEAPAPAPARAGGGGLAASLRRWFSG